MASITNSIESLFSGSASIVEGLAESVLAVLRHVFDTVIGLLRGVIHVSEEVVVDTWTIIESVVKGLFANIVPLLLVAFGALAGIIVALSARNKSAGQSRASAGGKGKKKRA
ncbi:unnamed protein product [Jaminaea pallidilutea]